MSLWGLDRDLYVSALREAGFATTMAETPAAATKWLEEAAVLDVMVVDLLSEPKDAWALIWAEPGEPTVGIPRGWVPGPRVELTDGTYDKIFTTTRRFCARPARVLFGATGFASP